MQTLRRSEQRGGADHGWLKAKHSFSFAGYYDPAHMGFRSLRVINQDRIAGGRGFGSHPHNNMEIITYVLEGALEHRDSMGNSAVIRPGEVQYMSAGTGVVHSEHNPDPAKETHLLQIWIEPAQDGGAPRYDQRSFAEAIARDKMALVVSPDGKDGSIALRQDARIYAGRFLAGDSRTVPLAADRGAWIQLVSGTLQVSGETLSAGDALAIEDKTSIELSATTDAHFLLFDLA
jgi:redox-sensitive bicupin YhaK (pirin superfamily)